MIETTFFDYSEHTEKMKQLQRQLFDNLLKKDYNKAIEISEELIVQTRAVRTWCLEQQSK